MFAHSIPTILVWQAQLDLDRFSLFMAGEWKLDAQKAPHLGKLGKCECLWLKERSRRIITQDVMCFREDHRDKIAR